MSQKYTYLSEEGYHKLEEELAHLRNVKRPEISNQIAEARDKGDLSENAEYEAAKEAQGLLELKISKMEATLQNARILKKEQLNSSKVVLLSTVKIKNLNTGKDMSYQIVSENEADLKAGRISIESPIGHALIGKSKNDEVQIEVPAGKVKFKILNISV